MDVVFTQFFDFLGDVMVVEEPVLVTVDSEGSVFVLQVLEDQLEVSPVDFFVLELSANFSSGMWVVFFDHFNKVANHLIETFDSFS